MRFFTLIAASALVALAGAQSSTTIATSTTADAGAATGTGSVVSTTAAATTSAGVVASTQSQQMPPSATAGFNPNNVSTTERTDWCRAQRNNCRAICGGGPSQNDCTEATLTYQCTCYNGTVPDMTRYTNTLPYYICVATRDQCVDAHPDDLAGQETCMEVAQCGTIAPPEIESDTTTTSSGGGSGGSGGNGGSPSATSATTSSTSNAAMVYGTEISTGAFAALLMAVFKFLL